MLRPNFEEPLDTAKQLLDKNITLYFGHQSWKNTLSQSIIPEYRKLAEASIVTNSWAEYENYTEHYVIGEGTHAMLTGNLYPYELAMGRWWRSKEKLKEMSLYGGYHSNPKWIFNEVCIN